MWVASIDTVVRCAAVAALVMGAIALFPVRVAAECGNYVTILDEPRESHDAVRRLPSGQQFPTAPCHGPGCSQVPSIPFTPLPTAVSSSLDAKAWLSAVADDLPAGRDRPHPPSCDGEPVHFPGSIFHPPRA